MDKETALANLCDYLEKNKMCESVSCIECALNNEDALKAYLQELKDKNKI